MGHLHIFHPVTLLRFLNPFLHQLMSFIEQLLLMLGVRCVFPLVQPKKIIVNFGHARRLLLSLVETLNNLADWFLDASPDQGPFVRYVT
jgi:hypothetical protein